MEKILRVIFGIKDLKFRCDDDFIDRLSRRYSITILLVFAVLVTTKQYVGDPIYCWCPAHFTDSHKNYANTVCWVKNTYYVALEDQLPLPEEKKEHLSYYQWVPMILLFQTLLCYLPSVLWRFMCRRSGLNIAALMDAALAGQRTSYADIREKTVRYVVYQMDRYLHAREHIPRGCCARARHAAAKHCCLIFGKIYGNFLSVSYVLTKMCYLANSAGQLFVLDWFLGNKFHLYGIEVMNRFVNGEDWTVSARFPRVTMCNFKVRHMNVLQPYVLQCVLPINLFNEKIFLFVWFWLFALALLTAISLLRWVWLFFFWPAQVTFVRRQLKPMDTFKPQKDVIRKFVQNYLKRDGILVIRLISGNVGDLVAQEALQGLWEQYGIQGRHLLDNGQGSINDVWPSRPARLPESIAQRMRRMDSV